MVIYRVVIGARNFLRFTWSGVFHVFASLFIVSDIFICHKFI